jgi:hypothetical protein
MICRSTAGNCSLISRWSFVAERPKGNFETMWLLAEITIASTERIVAIRIFGSFQAMVFRRVHFTWTHWRLLHRQTRQRHHREVSDAPQMTRRLKEYQKDVHQMRTLEVEIHGP